ncbi:MAG: ATP-binding protein, partial [Armatimonadota bacterium]
EDFGPGIPVEEQDRIFSRFYTLRKSTADGRRGLGLGLSICKAIVEAHGGIIQVEKKSKGSLFRFSIPAENNPRYAEEL